MPEARPVLFRIPPSGLDDLAAVAGHADKLPEIIAFVIDSPVQLSRPALAKRIASKLSLLPSAARDVIDGLATLRSLMDRLNLSVEDVLASIDRSIQEQATDSWKSQHLEKWEGAKEKILAALRSLPADSNLSIQQKVRDLTFAHQRIFSEASLITDLRPVFNATGDKIRATVLTHVLSIRYQDGGRSRQVEFAPDAADISNLFKSIERSQIKTEATRKAFAEKAWELIVPGAGPTAGEERQ